MRRRSRARTPDATGGRLAAAVAALSSILPGGLGCVGPAGPEPPLPATAPGVVVERVVAPPVTSEARRRARSEVVMALDALAQGVGHLLGEETQAGVAYLEQAQGHVAAARTLLPPEVVWVRGPRGGEPLRVIRPQPPVVVSFSELGSETVERLRGYRHGGAQGLRVDLEELERRLARALSAPPERALGEILLAAGTALRFEPAGASSLADGVRPETGTEEVAGGLRG